MCDREFAEVPVTGMPEAVRPTMEQLARFAIDVARAYADSTVRSDIDALDIENMLIANNLISYYGVVPVELPEVHISQSKRVAVGDREWQPMETCPHGVKVALLNPGKVATYGIYNGTGQWLGWDPLPRVPKEK